MGNRKIAALALLAAGSCLLLSGCGTIDEDYLNTEVNTSVEINMPYATATPLPQNMAAPEAIVIDADGNVTLNDASVIEGDFQSARDQEEQTEYRSLSLGSTGIAVQALQLRLRDLGYFDGDVSGLFDAQTEAAVKRFEQTYGTMQTGVATAKLQLKLFAASAPAYGSEAYNDAVISQYTVLRPGTVGSSVYALQQRLKNLESPITELTGVFDEETAECVLDLIAEAADALFADCCLDSVDDLLEGILIDIADDTLDCTCRILHELILEIAVLRDLRNNLFDFCLDIHWYIPPYIYRTDA